MDNQDEDRQQESEANSFAAFLLIPEEILLERLKTLDLSDNKAYDRLCSDFGVSYGLMAYRFMLLGQKGEKYISVITK
ncbi:uncharacterized protein DUF955 [Pontibacter ummariensis]|uniref:IrrE N-terminal-like domain-containing protein n=1 Tax=Pontibacter ummariensis TaxID=1610492 RepID=A0A239DVB0_9BACT|nr:ImmA/IrrE family metallo-endopeptidase [Pontibacter ummariensis]PRY13736.1 uncharacterized protein DUF955 [Pontibacter ummariensis]SNS36410.1 protein of unknown function [Pontibacter ummariensis]